MIAETEKPSFAALADREDIRQRNKRQSIMTGSFTMSGTVLPNLPSLPKFDIEIQSLPKVELRILDTSLPKSDAVIQAIRRARPSLIVLDLGEDFSFSNSTRRLAVTASASLSHNLEKRIKSLADLRFNWDGEGAEPVKPHILADAVETLKRLGQQNPAFREPFIVPTYSGFLQMEWHHQNRSLELEATEEGWSAVGSLVGVTGEPQYFTVEFDRNNIAQIEKLYQWLSGYHLWPLL